MHLKSNSKVKYYDEEGMGLVAEASCDVKLPRRVDSDPETEEKNRASFWSLVINFGLLIVKVILSYVTGSLSFLASAVDSFLDLISQSIIFCAVRGNRDVDERVYPVGRGRLEPLSIVIVAAVMGMASLQVVLESFYRIIHGFESEGKIKVPTISTAAILMLITTIGLKVLLYLMCKKLAKNSDSMNALAEDHKNDILSNLVALLAAWLASRHKILWFLDPVGAIGISIFIVLNWLEMAKEQTDKLVGRTADRHFIRKIEKLAEKHDLRLKVDIVRAYYFGHRYLVEIEIVMKEDTTLRIAHDVALSLQQKVEELDEVERCHVHVDYDFRTEREHKATYLTS